MADKPEVFLFAGPGLSTQANTDGLLSNFIPQEIEYLVIPEKIGRSKKGLMTVWNWISGEFSDAPDAVEQVTDMAVALRDAVADDSVGKVTLVLLWGEDGDQECRDLLTLATELGVPVKDLTDGLDDLEFSEGPEDTPADPEPQAPRAGRRSRRAAAPEEPKPAEEPSEPRRRGRARTQPAVSPAVLDALENGVAVNDEVSAEVTKDLPGLGKGFPVTIPELAAFVDARISIHLFNAAKAAGLQIAVTPVLDEPKAPAAGSGRGRPRSDGTPAQPDPHKDEQAFYVKDDEYRRRGRGKPPAGYDVVWLTAAQCEELGLEFG